MSMNILSTIHIEQTIAAGLDGLELAGKRVLLIVPDGTRSAPMPLLFGMVHRLLAERGARMDAIIALGTHQPMTRAAIERHLGVALDALEHDGTQIFNHQWEDPATFVSLGTIAAERVAAISGGMLAESVEVRVNKLALEYDRLLICGPVFPHEVVGFSGGNKYLFPGIGGQAIIDLSHWLGALITSYAIIGTPGTTPVRALIDAAAALIPTPKSCIAMVVHPGTDDLDGIWIDTPELAWERAAALAAEVHVRYLERPYRRVLAIIPPMYPEIWTAAKGMYKLEPVVAEGGELVVYAPHIREFSATHGAALARIGYHTRDYFLANWETFGHEPRGVIAHSTHLRGIGSMVDGVERPRIAVTLATSIDAARCAAHSIGYRDPASIDIGAWRADPETLVVDHAGEQLYRLRP